MENTIVIEYCGAIQYETIGELIHKLKVKVHELDIQVGTYKRLLLIMIESLENIMKHSYHRIDGKKNEALYLPVFSITKKGCRYKIMSSNLINTGAIEPLRKKLDLLNSMDAKSLKEYYKETITNGVFTNTGGAGLGMIEIAKISGIAIQYEFLPVDAACFRFIQCVAVEEGGCS